MKQLIVNADDFGLSDGINRGIIEAFKFGTLTSASLMANMAAFEDAIGLIRQHPNLGIGVHLNILIGRPLISFEEAGDIVDDRGYFLRSPLKLIRRILRKKRCLLGIEKELRAQIEKIAGFGITITHLDSHKHIHCYPHIFNIVIKLAKEFGIKGIRCINERLMQHENVFQLLMEPKFYRLIVLNNFCQRYYAELKNNDILHTNYFLGFFYSGSFNVNIYKNILMSLREGTTEIMLHPGYYSSELNSLTSFTISREEELKILLNPNIKDTIINEKIKLIDHRELI